MSQEEAENFPRCGLLTSWDLNPCLTSKPVLVFTQPHCHVRNIDLLVCLLIKYIASTPVSSHIPPHHVDAAHPLTDPYPPF